MVVKSSRVQTWRGAQLSHALTSAQVVLQQDDFGMGLKRPCLQRNFAGQSVPDLGLVSQHRVLMARDGVSL
jgi:hypothetical protein